MPCVALAHTSQVVSPLPLPALALPRHDPDDEAVNVPRAVTSVLLARTRGKSAFYLFRSLKLMPVFCRMQVPLESS